MVQVGQRGWRNTRCSKTRPDASDRIQHPRRHDRDHTWRALEMDDFTISPPLTVVPTDTAPMKRMPLIVDNDILPDMGRMTLR
jgi:hypothetical protein